MGRVFQFHCQFLLLGERIVQIGLHGADGRTSGVQVQRGGWISPIHRIEYIPHDRLVGMCI